MRKLNLTKAALWCTAISPLILTACVDDSYDLSKDIDMTITVGGNLGIPGGGTEEFTLEDIMDLDDPENSILQADPKTGNYSLLKSETGDVTEVKIDGVSVDEPDVTPSTKTLNFTSPVSIGDEVKTEVSDVKTDLSFTTEEIENVISIKSATVNGTANLTLDFTSLAGNVQEITLQEEFTLKIEVDGQENPNTIQFELNEEEDANVHNYYKIEGQTIKFTQNRTVHSGRALIVPIRFTRIECENFPEGQGLKDGTFSMNVNVIANGTATTPGLSFGNIQIELITGADLSKFTLTEVTGRFSTHDEISVEPVAIDDVPDFLSESGNTLDIKNPCIKFELTSNAPIKVNLTGELDRIKNKKSDLKEPINIGNPNPHGENAIILYPNTTSTYFISRAAMPDSVDEVNHKYNIVLGEDIYELIKTIPDTIKLINGLAEAVKDEDFTIALNEDGNTYTVEPKYELNAPLQFGPELRIEYNDTINDWQSDLEDITFKQAVVEMTALNGIPLNFGIEATAIDVNGDDIPNVKAEVEGNIKPGNKIKGGEGTATESPITVRLRSENGSIKNLDGLRIKLIGNTEGAADAVLNKNMSLQLTNIRIRIEGGVTMDLN